MLIIGIAGGTGSGKTTWTHRLVELLPKESAAVISLDHYYKDNRDLSLDQRKTINYDTPQALDIDLLIDHLKTLKTGHSIKTPVYCFKQHRRTEEFQLISPKKVILVEGILLLSIAELRKMIDLKIYLDCVSDVRLVRRITRDMSERNRSLLEVVRQYQRDLKPMHTQYIKTSKKYADLIIPTQFDNPIPLQILQAYIQQNAYA